MSDIMEQIFDIAKAGARGHQLRFALERVAKLEGQFMGMGEINGDTVLEDLRYIASQIRAAQ